MTRGTRPIRPSERENLHTGQSTLPSSFIILTPMCAQNQEAQNLWPTQYFVPVPYTLYVIHPLTYFVFSISEEVNKLYGDGKMRKRASLKDRNTNILINISSFPVPKNSLMKVIIESESLGQ